jgi:hypothetical protein
MPQQKAEGVTIGFLGTGSMDVDSATDLIEEFIESVITSDEDPVTFVFPLTTDEFSDTMEELSEMAKKSDITYEVITSTSDKGRRRFTEIAGSAAKTYHVADVYTQMEHILTEAPRSLLEVLWDKEREEQLGEIVGKFLDAEIDVRDLTDGNSPMGEESEVQETQAAASPAVIDVQAVEKETDEEEELPIYARSDLEKLSRANVKEIALKLGLPPRKSSAAMIEEIMEAQGEPEETEEAEEAEETAVIAVVAEEAETEIVAVAAIAAPPMTGNVSELVEALDRLPTRLHDVFDEAITSFAKTIEGLVFNAQPEQPMPVEEPARRARRLVRAR